MTLPPTDQVLNVLSQSVLPALGGAAVVYCLFAAAGRWATALGSAAAVVFAFAWANYAFPWLFAREDAPRPDLWGTGRLIPWKPDDPARAWMWLPKAALVLVVVGLVSRWIGLIAHQFLTQPVELTPFDPPTRKGRYWWGASLLMWAPRVAAVLLVSGWVISERVSSEQIWLRPIFVTAVLLNWVALDGVARAGSGAQVAAYLWALLTAGGTVMLYAHSIQFMEPAVVLGFAMLGIALAAASARGDTSGAVPVGALFLPGLMLVGRASLVADSHKVPAVCFWLVALAPLALLPFCIPAVTRLPRWVVVPLRILLILIPAAVAVYLADRHETPAYTEW
jgi:hypothetical protein